MYVLYIVVCRLYFFLLVIALSVLLRFTDSEYPFGIFKHLLLQESNIACEEANTNFMVFGLTRQWLEPDIYGARGVRATYYTTDAT